MTIFDCLKEVISEKRGDLHLREDFKEGWNTFMICRYLSMDNRFASAAAKANELQTTLGPEEIYKLLVRIVPQHPRSYIKYIAKKRKK